MKVLVVNAGSSSLKLQVLDGSTEVAGQTIERWHDSKDLAGLADFIGFVEGIEAVGHRVVHGGSRYRESVRIDSEVLGYLESIVDLAPLHEPKAIAAIRKMQELLPDLPQVACFDTAFHSTIPPAAATYAVPAEWNQRWDLRRYGFHGLSHAYASRRAAELLKRDVQSLRIVSCHLGAGASLCAIRNGMSVDTTMGFTPFEGLVMATRSGDVDPGLMLWLLQTNRLSVAELADGLEFHGGLAGLSGTSGDLRDVVAAADDGENNAQLAIDVFVHRLVTEIGRMIVSAGGLDVLLFTGGIGEHRASVRRKAVERLAFLGLQVDVELNEASTTDGIVSPAASSSAVVVVTAREDLQIAQDVTALV